MSNSLRPHGLQHTRLPCPSPTPRACSNSCPLSWGYHPTSSSSVVPFSSRLPSFPASGSFPVNQLFTPGGQSIGASASVSASVLPMYIQDWFPLGLTGLISLQSKGLSRVFSNTTVQKHQFFSAHLRNTLLCILHLFPFQHFPPAQPQCCLSFRSLYAVNLMKTDLLHFNMSSLSFVYGVWWRWWCFWCSGRHFQLSVNVDSLFFLWNEPSWIICLPNLPCRWDGHFETMPHRVNRTWNLNRNPWVCLTEQ